MRKEIAALLLALGWHAGVVQALPLVTPDSTVLWAFANFEGGEPFGSPSTAWNETIHSFDTNPIQIDARNASSTKGEALSEVRMEDFAAKWQGASAGTVTYSGSYSAVNWGKADASSFHLVSLDFYYLYAFTVTAESVLKINYTASTVGNYQRALFGPNFVLYEDPYTPSESGQALNYYEFEFGTEKEFAGTLSVLLQPGSYGLRFDVSGGFACDGIPIVGGYPDCIGQPENLEAAFEGQVKYSIKEKCSAFPGGGNTEGCFPGPGPFPAPEPRTLALLLLALPMGWYIRRLGRR